MLSLSLIYRNVISLSSYSTLLHTISVLSIVSYSGLISHPSIQPFQLTVLLSIQSNQTKLERVVQWLRRSRHKLLYRVVPACVGLKKTAGRTLLAAGHIVSDVEDASSSLAAFKIFFFLVRAWDMCGKKIGLRAFDEDILLFLE